MQTQTQAANTDVVITLPASSTAIYEIEAIHCSYSAQPTAGALSIEADGTKIYEVDITTSGPAPLPFSPPIRGSVGQELTVTLHAAGAGVIGKLNVDSRLI